MVDDPAIAEEEQVDLASRLPLISILSSLLTAGFAGGYGLACYDELPERIPVHFDLQGRPDGFSAKSLLAVLALPLMSLVISLLFNGSTWLIQRSRIAPSAARLGVPAWALGRFQRANIRYLSVLALSLCLMLALGQVATIRFALGETEGLSRWFAAFCLAVVVFALGGALYLALHYGQGGRRLLPAGPLRPTRDDAHWHLGCIYRNAEDPAFFVPHRFGFGYTINVGNKKAVFLLAALLILYFGGLFALFAFL